VNSNVDVILRRFFNWGQRGLTWIVLTGCQPSVWKSWTTGRNFEGSLYSTLRTNIFGVGFFMFVALRFLPYGLVPAALMVVFEIITILISIRFLLWILSSLYGDYNGGCPQERYDTISVWAGALHVPMLIGASLGVWTEPWIAFPLFRIIGILYGLFVLKQFMAFEMKVPSDSLKKVWYGVSFVWLLVLLGARVLSLSFTAPIWIDTLTS
jgi:hypothetical protein